MSKNDDTKNIVNLFTGKPQETPESVIRGLLDEGRFKDSQFALVVWKDITDNPLAEDREREYVTSGVTYGTLLWELELFKNSLMFGA